MRTFHNDPCGHSVDPCSGGMGRINRPAADGCGRQSYC